MYMEMMKKSGDRNKRNELGENLEKRGWKSVAMASGANLKLGAVQNTHSRILPVFAPSLALPTSYTLPLHM
jgi:hypothetical protein